jgi:hypothetical protein
MTVSSKRSPIIYVCVIGLASWLGLYARQYALGHASLPADCAADTFWALTVFAGLGLLFPAMPTWQATVGAFVISASFKLGQLYHASWLDALIGTQAGSLILGTDLVVTDLACYAAGAVVGMLIELWTLD